MTGILNRRAIMDSLKALLIEEDGIRVNVSIGMMDLDHFKEINDQYGHHIGDEALKHFVRVVQSCLRETDLLARFGGDEFILVVPKQKEGSEAAVFQRVCDTVRQTPWLSTLGEISVTVSIGVATTHGEITLDELLARADKALYQAKNTGRNRIAQFSDNPISIGKTV